MRYWKIENIGSADINGLLLLGGTTKRDTDDQRIIGTFGSGFKQSMALLLREGIVPVIYSDRIRMDYKTKPVFISGVAHQQMFVQLKGTDSNGASINREEDLKCTLKFGATDWTDIGMSLREIVSNSIDALYTDGKSHRDIKIELVDDNQVRAKAGTMRVFIPATEEISKYFVNIGQYFLHLGEEKFLGVRVIDKSQRQERELPAKLYRRGVLVRKIKEIQEIPALFDYNLPDLQLDDSRNYSDYGALSEAARAISNAPEDILVTYLQSFLSGKTYLEHTLDSFQLSCKWHHNTEKEERWKNAWRKAFGELGVACNTEHGFEVAMRKGYKAVRLPNRAYEAAKAFGIKTETDVLSDFEARDLILGEPTADIIRVADVIWECLASKGRLNGKAKPTLKTFTRGMNAGSITMGFYHDNIVAINNDIANGINQNLISTVLEEFLHHITGAQDCTRDFQTACIDLAASFVLDMVK